MFCKSDQHACFVIGRTYNCLIGFSFGYVISNLIIGSIALHHASFQNIVIKSRMTAMLIATNDYLGSEKRGFCFDDIPVAYKKRRYSIRSHSISQSWRKSITFIDRRKSTKTKWRAWFYWHSFVYLLQEYSVSDFGF